jgi:hypothetical protein
MVDANPFLPGATMWPVVRVCRSGVFCNLPKSGARMAIVAPSEMVWMTADENTSNVGQFGMWPANARQTQLSGLAVLQLRRLVDSSIWTTPHSVISVSRNFRSPSCDRRMRIAKQRHTTINQSREFSPAPSGAPAAELLSLLF